MPYPLGTAGGVPGGFAGGPPPFLPCLPPRCPLIIKIGRGLANPVRSTVVSGRANCT